MRLSRERFEQLAEKVLEALPARFADALGNLEICVKMRAGGEAVGVRGARALLGLYVSGEPARIFLYQRNIEELCADESEIEREVGLTLRHEIGHHFGLGESDLHRAGH